MLRVKGFRLFRHCLLLLLVCGVVMIIEGVMTVIFYITLWSLSFRLIHAIFHLAVAKNPKTYRFFIVVILSVAALRTHTHTHTHTNTYIHTIYIYIYIYAVCMHCMYI